MLIPQFTIRWMFGLTAALYGFGVEHVTTAPLIVVRGLWLGAIAGASAYAAARWTFEHHYRALLDVFREVRRAKRAA